MYNQSEPRIDPPEDMDDYREAQSGILVANQKIRILEEKEAKMDNKTLIAEPSDAANDLAERMCAAYAGKHGLTSAEPSGDAMSFLIELSGCIGKIPMGEVAALITARDEMLLRDAANRIAELEAQLKEARDALGDCERWMVEHGCSHEYAVLRNIRAILAAHEGKGEEAKEATCELVAFDHTGAGKIALRLNLIKTPQFPFELTIGNKYVIRADVERRITEARP